MARGCGVGGGWWSSCRRAPRGGGRVSGGLLHTYIGNSGERRLTAEGSRGKEMVNGRRRRGRRGSGSGVFIFMRGERGAFLFVKTGMCIMYETLDYEYAIMDGIVEKTQIIRDGKFFGSLFISHRFIYVVIQTSKKKKKKAG